MLDIKFIRDNADIVKEAVRKKHAAVDIDELIGLDDQRRELQAEVEDKRAEQNYYSKNIPNSDPSKREGMITEMQALKEQLQKKETELSEIMEKWREHMLTVPNVPDISVPEGKDDDSNQEIRTWGEANLSFEPKSHIELAESHDLVDFKQGTSVAGFRGYFLKNEAVDLSFGLWNMARHELAQKGFEPMIAPSLAGKEPFYGTGYLPDGEEDLYQVQDEKYLAGTSEVSVMGSFMDKTFEKQDLPIKVVAFSPCFRREAGSHGKDTKGLMRVHEFYKVEQIVICEASHETSVSHHEQMLANAEELTQKLEIPYRVVVNCGGDLGLGQVKKYDIETWVPSEGTYRETHSASYFHDFQSRRLNIRYRDDEGGRPFVHTLNNTAVATPRMLISLLENHQRQDGKIHIPKALQNELGKDTIG